MLKKAFEAVVPQRLSSRIAVLMTLAMLPIGLISVYQTRAVAEDARDARNAARLGEITAAATQTRRIIYHAIGSTTGLGSQIAGAPEADCSDALSRFVEQTDPYVFAGFINTDGRMVCSSSGEELDFSQSPGFIEAMAERTDRIEVSRQGVVSGQPVIIVSHPVFNGDELKGFLAVSLPLALAVKPEINKLPGTDVPSDLVLMSLAVDENIISSTVEREEAARMLPSQALLTKLQETPGRLVQGQSQAGELRNYVIVSMANGAVSVLGTWPQVSALQSGRGAQILLALAFPILMWMAGVGVALYGLQRVVVRHIKLLRTAMRQFALGQRTETRLELDDPPEEIEQVQRAFNRMSMIITDSEQQQTRDLRDKEVLLREVHHRVKNNLQLIASIMNMQLRQTKSEEARANLNSLQRRVRGLATLHRTLYTTPNLITVDTAELVRAVLDDTAHLVPDSQIHIRSDLDSTPLFPDQAVPLSMLTAEALTNAFKHAASTKGEGAVVEITLKIGEGNTATMAIWNSLPEGRTLADDMASDGLGTRLMDAFVSQLGGTKQVNVGDNYFELLVTFPIQDFSPESGQGNGS